MRGLVLVVLAVAAASATTYPLLPGLEGSLGQGFDAVIGATTYSTPFALTYAVNATWSNPLKPDKIYSVPDHVKVVVTPSAGSESEVFKTSADYAHSLSVSVGLGLNIKGFGLSATYSQQNSNMEDNSRSLTLVDDHVTFYTVGLPPMIDILELDDTFKDVVNQLPTAFDPTPYQEFVNSYGTHFVSAATYGGSVHMIGTTESAYSSSTTSYAIQANAKVQATGAGQMGGSFAAGYSYSSTNSEYSSAMNKNFHYVGGGPNGTFADWLAGLPAQPDAVKKRVRPITELFDVGPVRDNLETFVAEYLSNNSYSGSPPAPPMGSVGRCSCVTEPLGTGCPTGTVSFGTVSVVDSDYLDLSSGQICCAPCISWASPGPFGSVVARKTVGLQSGKGQQGRVAAVISGSDAAPTRKATSSVIPVPGLDRLGSGYDAAYGEIRPAQAVQFGPLNQTYTTKNGTTYFYPAIVGVDTERIRGVTTDVHASASSFASKMSTNAGLSGTYAGFTASASVSYSNSFYEQSQSVLAVYKDTYSELQLGIVQNLAAPTPMFRTAVDRLGACATFGCYLDFVGVWGTHYVSGATMGGEIRSFASVDHEMYSSMSETDVETQVGYLIAFLKTGVKDMNMDSTTTSSTFAEFYTFGGSVLDQNGHPLDFGDFNFGANADYWALTAVEEPASIQDKLQSLATLVNWNATLQAQMASWETKYFGLFPAPSEQIHVMQAQFPNQQNLPDSDPGNCQGIGDQFIQGIGEWSSDDDAVCWDNAHCTNVNWYDTLTGNTVGWSGNSHVDPPESQGNCMYESGLFWLNAGSYPGVDCYYMQTPLTCSAWSYDVKTGGSSGSSSSGSSSSYTSGYTSGGFSGGRPSSGSASTTSSTSGSSSTGRTTSSGGSSTGSGTTASSASGASTGRSSSSSGRGSSSSGGSASSSSDSSGYTSSGGSGTSGYSSSGYTSSGGSGASGYSSYGHSSGGYASSSSGR